MSDKSFSQIDSKVLSYVYELFQPEDAVLGEIRARSLKAEIPQIHVGNMDGLHLEILARMSGAKKAVEIGTLVGYSGVCVLRGMGAGSKLYTFEYEPKHAEVARETFKKAGLLSQVEIRVGAALEKLPEITSQGPFDLVFIDADKPNYPKYLDWAAENLRVGGVVIGDNTFAFGMLADERFETKEDEEAVHALRELNQKIANGGRFRGTILPTGEGLTIGVKI